MLAPKVPVSPSPTLHGRRIFCGLVATASASALALVASGCRRAPTKVGVNPNESTFRPGQRFTYRTRQGEESSTLTVIRVEGAETLGIIVHVSIDGLKMRYPKSPSGIAETIAHMPFAESAVHRSVTALIGTAAPSAAAEAGYAEWRRAYEAGKAGIYSISVAEAVDTIARSLSA